MGNYLFRNYNYIEYSHTVYYKNTNVFFPLFIDKSKQKVTSNIEIIWFIYLKSSGTNQIYNLFKISIISIRNYRKVIYIDEDKCIDDF